MLQQDSRENPDADAIIADIRSQLSAKDNSTLDFLLDGWDSSKLGEDFYREAAKSSSHFIREYFDFDLGLRNAKVEYLNRKLSRPVDQDTVDAGQDPEFEDREKVDAVLETDDILGREKGLDDLLWQKIDDITVMDVFTPDVILGFVAKLKIIDRWFKLDEATGRELFAKLVKEIKENYTI